MCMINDGDGYCTVIKEAQQKARQQHQCTECHRQIRIGETYLYEFAKFDGVVFVHKTCAHCQALRQWLYENCGFIYGEIEEDFRDHALDYGSMRMLRAAVGCNKNWTKKNGQLMAVPVL